MLQIKFSSSRRKRPFVPGTILLIIFVVLSFVLMTASAKPGGSKVVEVLRSGAQTVVYPLETAGNFVTKPFKGLTNVGRNITASQETLTELEEKNKQLESQNAQLEEYRLQNERLTSLLQMRDTYGLNTITARVLSGSADNWSRVTTIDKGSLDGVEVGMPVLDSAGLIGQVTSVALNSSKVRLIFDEQSGVAVYIQKNRAQGILEGTSTDTLILNYISVDTDVAVGDKVITSGLGGVYPKGLLVGEVSSINKDPGALFAEIVVQPASNFKSVEEVLVITEVNASIEDNETSEQDEDSNETDVPVEENKQDKDTEQ